VVDPGPKVVQSLSLKLGAIQFPQLPVYQLTCREVLVWDKESGAVGVGLQACTTWKDMT
jgi:hypothetical protein